VFALPQVSFESNNAEEAFNAFATTFNKTYASNEERSHRFDVFVENARMIQTALVRGYRLALNQFSDLTKEEFAQKYLVQLSTPELSRRHQKLTAPSQAIDWVAKGAVTPVKSQGVCDSAVAMAIVETVESSNAVVGKPLTPGSVAELVECGPGAGQGCGEGDPIAEWNWVLKEGGLASAACYGPPTGTCHKDQCKESPNPNLLLGGIKQVTADETSLYQALADSPVFVCVDASQWQFYAGGVLPASSCSRQIDHCVQLTGYSPDKGGYWILRNSWGVEWGMSGYIHLQFGSDTCGITKVAISAKP